MIRGMNEDEAFVRAILAAPDDITARLVYADWLDDRADPRADYVRLGVRAAALPLGDANRLSIRDRMRELQARLPSWWLAVLGFRATRRRPDPENIDEAARLLERPAKYTDPDGYEMRIDAAVFSGLTGAVASLEARSKYVGAFHDIRYDLRLRDAAGRAAECVPYTYNPYFGCRPEFMEWYGDAVLMIYGEKHGTYALRFGFDGPPVSRKVSHRWLLDGHELAFRHHGEPHVSRVSVPDLADLPPLSEAEARERELWPE